MKIAIGILCIIAVVSFTGCGERNSDSEGVPENNGYEKPLKLSNAEVERRIREYTLDLDAAANLGELFDAIAKGLGVEIEVEATGISPETTVSLKNSRQSFIIQILETITSSTRTRYEVRKGRIILKDAD